MNKIVYDIGASNIKYAVMTAEGDILRHNSVPVPRDSLENYLNTLYELAAADIAECDGAAVSTNGRMEPDGDTYRAYTMGFLTGVNLRTELEARLHMPVVVENDGMAAAIGEWWKGAGRGTRNMMGVVMGTSMGSGLVLNSQPYYGSRKNAAMVFGMLTSSTPDKNEYLASAFSTVFPLVVYKVAAAKQLDPASVNGHDVFRWAAEGDPVAYHCLESYYRAIAVTIFNSALLLDLDCVVLTGGLAAQPLLIDGVRRGLKDIAARAFSIPGIDMSALGVSIDPRDFEIDLRAGELCLDANLYGALYQLLHRDA